MGNCNALSKAANGKSGNTKSTLDRLIDRVNAPINAKQAGATYRKLPERFKHNIEENLRLTDSEIQQLKRGTRIKPEWTVALNNTKDKIKIEIDVLGSDVEYTVRRRNKILARTNNKNRVANQAAQYYSMYL